MLINKKIILSFLCLSVASCGMFSSDKIVLEGERISVLDGETILQPDYLPNQVSIDLPEPETNIAWEQNGGNSLHFLGHPNSADMITKLWSTDFELTGRGKIKNEND